MCVSPSLQQYLSLSHTHKHGVDLQAVYTVFVGPPIVVRLFRLIKLMYIVKYKQRVAIVATSGAVDSPSMGRASLVGDDGAGSSSSKKAPSDGVSSGSGKSEGRPTMLAKRRKEPSVVRPRGRTNSSLSIRERTRADVTRHLRRQNWWITTPGMAVMFFLASIPGLFSLSFPFLVQRVSTASPCPCCCSPHPIRPACSHTYMHTHIYQGSVGVGGETSELFRGCTNCGVFFYNLITGGIIFVALLILAVVCLVWTHASWDAFHIRRELLHLYARHPELLRQSRLNQRTHGLCVCSVCAVVSGSLPLWCSSRPTPSQL